MFLEEFIIGAKGFSFADVNRQFIVSFSTHEGKGLASIFRLNFYGVLTNIDCFKLDFVNK